MSRPHWQRQLTIPTLSQSTKSQNFKLFPYNCNEDLCSDLSPIIIHAALCYYWWVVIESSWRWCDQRDTVYSGISFYLIEDAGQPQVNSTRLHLQRSAKLSEISRRIWMQQCMKRVEILQTRWSRILKNFRFLWKIRPQFRNEKLSVLVVVIIVSAKFIAGLIGTNRLDVKKGNQQPWSGSEFSGEITYLVGNLLVNSR